jgi:hypothetical protein
MSYLQVNLENLFDFMVEEHHLVRNFVVRELPRVGAPLSPEVIARSLHLPGDRVEIID